MIFVANILAMNGGTTFLIRLCDELAAGGHRCAVVVLRRGGDTALTAELKRHADIIELEDYLFDRGHLFKRQLGVLAPIAWSRLAKALQPYGATIHAMSAFGLIFAARFARHRLDLRVTVGVYHQNEFLFHDRHFFSRKILLLFRSVPLENVIFFNETTQNNYSVFHNGNYRTRSHLTPIGVKLHKKGRLDRVPGNVIVSIGNLEKFKTYNEHIISLMPKLLEKFPKTVYNIYGEGPCLENLRLRAEELGVAEHVFFHGPIAYEHFHGIVRASDVFVGSGTAILEAASAVRPALVGVESIKEPITYGFLCDIQGLSYNELGSTQPMRPMLDYLEAIFRDPDQWQTVARACAVKVEDFSVERTVETFLQLDKEASLAPPLVSAGWVARMLGELPALALLDRMSPAHAFASRRNQSFEG